MSDQERFHASLVKLSTPSKQKECFAKRVQSVAKSMQITISVSEAFVFWRSYSKSISIDWMDGYHESVDADAEIKKRLTPLWKYRKDSRLEYKLN